MKMPRLVERPISPSAETKHDHSSEPVTTHLAQPSDHQIRATFLEYGEHLAQQHFQQLPDLGDHSPDLLAQTYQQHYFTTATVPQVPILEPIHDAIGQKTVLPMSWNAVHEHCPYGGGLRQTPAYQEHQIHPAQGDVHETPETDLSYDFLQLHQARREKWGDNTSSKAVQLPHGEQDQTVSEVFISGSDESISHPTPDCPKFTDRGHHHHYLPNRPPLPAAFRAGYSSDITRPNDVGPSSVVGLPGMPKPALRPKGPKLKFSPEDDALLVDLKEMNNNLTWKQIADFFPGRSSGTLQVRYCTKLKARTRGWTEDKIDRLRKALEEYEHDRWRIVAGSLGNGFSAASCKEKMDELNSTVID